MLTKGGFLNHLIYLACFLGSAHRSNGALEKIFQEPGLVWLEDDGRHARFHKVNLGAENWEWNIEHETPEIIAMTKLGNRPYTFVDVDFDNRTLVAVAKSGKRIMAVSFDQLGIQTHWQLFAGTSIKVNGITVDWITDVVYWTDAAYNAIFAVSMAHPNIAETIIENLDEPYGIAAHPWKGFLFWTDIGEHPKIMRSSLGGRKHRVVIEFVNRQMPTALAIDYSVDRIYWLYEHKDRRHQGFGSSDLYGNNIDNVKITEGGKYFDLDVFQGQIFLSNWVYNEIHVFSPTQREPLRTKLQGDPLGLVVLDPSRQVPRSNTCLYSRCPGVCTKSNTSEDCFCNSNVMLSVEPSVVGRYCGSKAFKGILIPKSDGIYSVVQNFAEFNRHRDMAPQRVIDSQHAIKAMTSDTGLMKIFYYESVSKIIKSSLLENDATSQVVSLAVGDVGGLAFDDSSKNLYWTDQELGHIMVAKHDGSYPYKLIQNLSRPKAIAVHPRRMYLYWSDVADMTLNRCFLDGTKQQKLGHTTKYDIYDVTIDYKTEKLYWTHRGNNSALYVSDLDGEGIEEIYASYRSFFTGVAVMHDYIIVSDSSYLSGGLHAVDKVKKRFVGKLTYPFFEHGNWFGVDFHHVSSEPGWMQSRCISHGNLCDQICVPNNSTQRYKCFCSLGYKINETDSNKCYIDSPNNPYVLLVDQRYQKLLQIDILTQQFAAIPAQQLKQPYALAFDHKLKMVYWSDLDAGTISRAYLDGRNQEIIVAQYRAYFISLDIDPVSRLLYYIVLSSGQNNYGPGLFGSLVAYQLDKSKSVVLIDRALTNPTSLVLNTRFGYVYFVDEGIVWRIDMNGSNMQSVTGKIQANLVASSGEFLCFTKKSMSENFYNTTIMRSNLDGKNATLLVEFQFTEVISLAVYMEYVYWIEFPSRSIQRMSVFNNHGEIENVGPSEQLILPTDIFVNPVGVVEESDCSDMLNDCHGICLPSSSVPSCVTKDSIISVHIEDSNATNEFCRIPSVTNGEVIGQKEHLVVPDGFRAHVKCFPLHKISSKHPMTCDKGKWKRIPRCTLEYDICGNEFRGYKVYTTSGQYFVYPSATKVEIICVGGGGGGYDVTNDVIVEAGKAGDGGDSKFLAGGSKQLTAYGGKGGTFGHGGAGGGGHYAGGDGATGINCTTGGTAGEYDKSTSLGAPGISYNLFCGSGGYSDDCELNLNTSLKRQFAGPGGKDGNGSIAGQYGGGAGSRTGGSGGGGGYSRLSFNLSPREVVDIEVGKAGTPSYGEAGSGIVVVTWGGLRIDDFVEEFDVTKECVISTIKKKGLIE